MPELPDDIRKRLPEAHGISLADTEVLLAMDDVEGSGVAYFERVVASGTAVTGSGTGDGKQAVNWIVNELLGRLARKNEIWTWDRVPPQVLGNLLTLVETGEMTGETGHRGHHCFTADESFDMPQALPPRISSNICSINPISTPKRISSS